MSLNLTIVTLRRSLIIACVLAFSSCLFGQLDSIHYLPPLRNATPTGAVNQQMVYLSTPVTTPFDVNIYQGTSGTPIQTLTGLVNGTPQTYDPGNGNNDLLMVSDANVGVVLSSSGLRFESSGGEKFYVNYRGRSTYQAASLTAKGSAALGTEFRWGGIPNRANSSGNLNSVLGVMATENGTTVQIAGYDTSCVFRLQTDASGLTLDTISITLNAGQSFVLEAIPENHSANVQGWIGAKITASNPIAVSNGGLNVGVISGAGSRDVAIDQSVPIERLGREYVFVRGNGVDALEFPIIIATQNATDVYVGGSLFGTIDDGEFLEIPGSNYSTAAPGGNMHVEASKPVYAYQALAGQTAQNTIGMNFIAPLNCLLPDTLDQIPTIHDIAGLTSGESAVTIIASASTPDGNITVTDQSGVVTLPASQGVAGTTDWKTFYVTGLTGNVSVTSTGNIAVGLFMRHGTAAGLAGYFSGFDTAPMVDVQVSGTGCIPGSTIQEMTGTFDAYQWFMDGSAISGETTSSYVPTGVGDFHVDVTQGTCTYSSNNVSLLACDYDLQITNTDAVDPIDEGDNAEFIITVHNRGVNPITGLVVTENFPAGFTFVSATPTVGTWSSPDWTVGTLASGEIQELRVFLTAENGTGGLFHSNTVTHVQNEMDSNLSPDDPGELIEVLQALPVELVDFEGDWVEGEKIKLTWLTVSEKGNEKFNIYHGTTGSDLKKIGEVLGSGSSISLIDYSFVHKNPSRFNENYYQLQQVDFNGTVEWSPMIHVAPQPAKGEEVLIYPNPVRNELVINADFKSLGAPQLFDMWGKPIDLNSRMTKWSGSTMVFDIESLQKGMYHVQMGDLHFNVAKQ